MSKPYPSSQNKQLKDHEVALMINELTASVPKYAHAQCLRGEIHRIVLKYLKPTKPDKTK